MVGDDPQKFRSKYLNTFYMRYNNTDYILRETDYKYIDFVVLNSIGNAEVKSILIDKILDE